MNKLLLLVIFVNLTMNGQKNLPNVTLSTLEGKKISIKNVAQKEDRLYILTFWATWCGPCITELDAMSSQYEAWKKEMDVEIIAISIDDSRGQKRVKPLLSGKKWNYNIYLDTNQDLKRALSIVSVPYTIVVKNQKIVHIQNGYVPGSEKQLYAKLKALK